MSVESAAQDLMVCLCTALGQVGWEGECCVSAGAVDLTQCCDQGSRAWVRLIDLSPTDKFPEFRQSVDPSKCAVVWIGRFELGALTCICMDECGCEKLTENAVATTRMAEAAVRAVVCCYATGNNLPDARVATVSMLDGSSGCGGFTSQVYVPIEVCCDADATPPC